MFFQGGNTEGTGAYDDIIGNVGNVWLWDAFSCAQYGDGVGKIATAITFGGRALIFDRKGDVYSLSGTPPVNFETSTNTLRIQKEAHLGDDKRAIIIEQAVDTGLGFLICKDQLGNLYWMDNALIPKPWGADITTTSQGDSVDIRVSQIRWDARDQRLWIHTDGFESRAYYADGEGEPTAVEVSARSFVWDAKRDEFWPVQNPLDAEDRTGKPAVFRDGNASWSCGCYFDADTDEFSFYLECDIAGKDPLPLYNSAEALTQPENSYLHNTSTTAYLVSKLFAVEDHAVQVRYLQSLARLIDGTDCTISAISEGVETELGAFSTATDFEALAHKTAKKFLNRSKVYNSVQFKLTITNAYADVLRNFMAGVDLAGGVR
jgi:hypothetical protein